MHKQNDAMCNVSHESICAIRMCFFVKQMCGRRNMHKQNDAMCNVSHESICAIRMCFL